MPSNIAVVFSLFNRLVPATFSLAFVVSKAKAAMLVASDAITIRKIYPERCWIEKPQKQNKMSSSNTMLLYKNSEKYFPEKFSRGCIQAKSKLFFNSFVGCLCAMSTRIISKQRKIKSENII